jgi:hypothetical protein
MKLKTIATAAAPSVIVIGRFSVFMKKPEFSPFPRLYQHRIRIAACGYQGLL